MFGIHNLPLYLLSCVLLNLTPGQDTVYIIGRSMAQGRRAGVVSVAGIMTGILIHTTFAALGLSAVLAASSIAFDAVKYAGAAYLVWLGIGLLRSGRPEGGAETCPTAPPGQRAWTVYRQGVLTNVLNPKVSLFFLSFLPQFVDPRTSHPVLPFVILGLILFTTGSIWCLILACCSSWLTAKFQGNGFAGGFLKKITGAVFIGMAVKLALLRQDG